MDNPKTQIADKIKEANNVLVTVSANPSVDQLAAAIGLTLLLTKLNKHATAVFSGEVPSTIEFLKPEETIETNTDSLRDFIIALDKAKADKLRYKVEDKMVKIFITPYRTSIGEEDLEFSEGDFNVDIVIALGVHSKDELDEAITSHGRILHDATVTTVNTKENSELGSINWVDAQASSLCEMVVALADLIKTNSLDAQMATALLTGIVAETERFSNAKTTSTTMNASAKLMTAGANQQLVASKLETAEPAPEPAPAAASSAEKAPAKPAAAEEGEDGTLSIDHAAEEEQKKVPEEPKPKEEDPTALKIEKEEPEPKPEPDKKEEQKPPTPPPPAPAAPPPPPPPPPPPSPPPPAAAAFGLPPKKDTQPPEVHPEHRKFLEEPPHVQREGNTGLGMPEDTKLVLDPPLMGGHLSASAMPDDFEPSTDQLSLPPVDPPILHHDNGAGASPAKPAGKAETRSLPLPPPNKPKHKQEPKSEPKPEPKKVSHPKSAALPPLPPLPPPPAPKAPPAHEDPTLPRAVIDVMDDRTLDSIEGSVKSPHQLLKNSGKTLNAIEETVASPHLKYEPHESEPPASSARSSAPLPLELPTLPTPSLAPPSTPLPIAPPPPPPLPPVPDYKPMTAIPPADTPLPPSSSASATDQQSARDAVEAAINSGGDGRTSAPALKSIGSTDFGVDLGHQGAVANPVSKNIHIDPTTGALSHGLADDVAPKVSDPTAPPPVPPPMMPPLPSVADNSV